MWISIDGTKFNTDNLVAIKPVEDGDEQCVIFGVGQSAVDGGFLIDQPIDEVFGAVQESRLLEIAEQLGSINDDGSGSDIDVDRLLTERVGPDPVEPLPPR